MNDCQDGFCVYPTASQPKTPKSPLSTQDPSLGIPAGGDIFRLVSAEEARREGLGALEGDCDDRDLGSPWVFQQQG